MLTFLKKLQTVLNNCWETNYTSIISQSVTDISRRDLLELDIPNEGLPVTSKPYSVPFKHREFMDQVIKQLDKAGIISRSMSNWSSPILIVPKKDERPVPTKPNSSLSNPIKPKKEFNLRLRIDYRKLNSQIVTARQINHMVAYERSLQTIHHLPLKTY